MAQEGSQGAGTLSWRLDLSELGTAKLASISASLPQFQLHSASALVTLCAGDACARVPPGFHLPRSAFPFRKQDTGIETGARRWWRGWGPRGPWS